jgi:hypothetical protein
MIDEDDCGAIGGVETEVLGEILPQHHLPTTNPT